MSMELVIPTFKRLDSQITLSNIPDSLLKNVRQIMPAHRGWIETNNKIKISNRKKIYSRLWCTC